jgi:uncharacterized protein (UPF0303 family)
MSRQKSSMLIANKPWTRDSAVALGQWLVNYGQSNQLPMAIAVILDNQRVFHFALEGTSAENDLWIERKRRTVELTKLSSLEYRESILQTGVEDSEVPLTDGVMAFCGGGYPLFDETGFRGVVIVSGLPHLQDDEIVAKAVKTFVTEVGDKK